MSPCDNASRSHLTAQEEMEELDMEVRTTAQNLERGDRIIGYDDEIVVRVGPRQDGKPAPISIGPDCARVLFDSGHIAYLPWMQTLRAIRE